MKTQTLHVAAIKILKSKQFVGFFFVATALQAGTVRTSGASGMEYESKDHAFTLKVPEDWIVDDSGIGGKLAIVKQKNKETGPSMSVTSLRVEDRTIEIEGEQLQKEYESRGFGVNSKRNTTVDKEAAVDFTFENKSKGSFVQVLMLIRKGKDYQFAAHLQTEQMQTYMPIFRELFQSIRWKVVDRHYSALDGLFSLEVPLHWTVYEFDKNHDIGLVGPAVGRVSPIITINVKPLEGGSLDEFIAKYLKESEKQSQVGVGEVDEKRRYLLFEKPGAAPEASNTRVFGTRRGSELLFKMDRFRIMLDSPSDNPDPLDLKLPESETLNIRLKQAFIPLGDSVAVVTLAALEENYETCRAQYEMILKTLVWKDLP